MSKDNDYDLFDNPMVRAAKAAMSQEDQEKYKKIGEKMYGHLNFEDPRIKLNFDIRMKKATNYIESQLRSGLHPSELSNNEVKIMEDSYGKKWFTKWGFATVSK